MNNLLLAHTNSYHGFSLEEAIKGIAAAGFKHVELSAVKGWTEHVMPEMSDAEIEKVQKLLSDNGITAVGLSAHSNLLDEKRLDDCRKSIELAAKLGCKYIISSTGEAHFGEEETKSDDELIKNIKSLLPLLEKHDVILTIETHGEVYGTGKSIYAVTKQIGSDYVGVNFDTANCIFWGGCEPMTDIKTCVDGVNYVHLKDKRGTAQKEWNFPGVGNGDLPLREFIEYMGKNGYEGPYSVEIEYTEEYCMRDKDQPGDIDIANKEMADSYKFLMSIFG